MLCKCSRNRNGILSISIVFCIRHIYMFQFLLAAFQCSDTVRSNQVLHTLLNTLLKRRPPRPSRILQQLLRSLSGDLSQVLAHIRDIIRKLPLGIRLPEHSKNVVEVERRRERIDALVSHIRAKQGRNMQDCVVLHVDKIL